jgi:hypothetical protein
MPDESKNVLLDVSNFPNGAKIIDTALAGQHNVLVTGGGVRGGKTFNCICALVLLHKLYPGSRSVIVRDYLSTLRLNTLPSCKKAVPSNFVKQFNSSTFTWTFHNGSEMFFMAEDYKNDKDFERFNGLEVNFILLEQFEELQRAFFDKALERLGSYVLPNGLKQPPPLLMATVNPTKNWVKQLVYDRWQNGTLPSNWIYIPTLVHQNPHIPASYLESLQALKQSNPIKYERFVNGDWELEDKVGGEFYFNFDFSKSVGEYKILYKEDAPLHITLDFNSLPYMTLLVWQIFDKKCILLEEFCMRPPQNTVRQTIKAFISHYQKHQTTISVYGDYSAKAKTPHDERLFDIVFSELSKAGLHSNDFVRPNPSVSTRGDFINEILGQKYMQIEIFMDENCKITIEDFMKTKKAPDGTKVKKREADPITKVSSEKYGHTSDASDYFICQAFKEDFDTFKKRVTIEDMNQDDNEPQSYPRRERGGFLGL